MLRPIAAGDLAGRRFARFPLRNVQTEVKIAEGLIAARFNRLAHHTLNHLLCLGILAFKPETAGLVHGFLKAGLGLRNRRTCPDGIFIQLNAFLECAAEHHRTQPAIADRQRFCPFLGRRRIPESIRIICPGNRSRQNQSNGKRHFHLKPPESDVSVSYCKHISIVPAAAFSFKETNFSNPDW